MKYNVLANGEIVNKLGPVSLDEATETAKALIGRLTIGAKLAHDQGNEALRQKNLSTRDSIRIVVADEIGVST